jgi:hypothetical protein
MNTTPKSAVASSNGSRVATRAALIHCETRGILMAGLNIEIFNTGYRPVPSAIPVWPDDRQATWPATTSTLISGERDGVLVDALVTKGESQELVDWFRRPERT